jgi:hypothetical protein
VPDGAAGPGGAVSWPAAAALAAGWPGPGVPAAALAEPAAADAADEDPDAAEQPARARPAATQSVQPAAILVVLPCECTRMLLEVVFRH